ncbi:MAG: hypothetical protein GIS02_02930 [Methanosarcinales archaeon]|uniref:Uncharacterized protein n=1 Tax=Candidatus Ethanoperedens thermophilum TaxID=2766897 RepID=A0A848D9W7_9EURY|nr:hypothetical protein [Candidatus Ethanoperedens thermophilum]
MYLCTCRSHKCQCVPIGI